MTRGRTRFGTRKSPVRHTRHAHYRKGKPVSETQVGNGDYRHLIPNNERGDWSETKGWKEDYDNKENEEVGGYVPISEIIRKNKEVNHHFFDKDTQRFFQSRWEKSALRKGDYAYFITSEKFVSPSGYSEPRKYTIRKANLKTGVVDTPSGYDFQQFNTKSQAKAVLNKIVK